MRAHFFLDLGVAPFSRRGDKSVFSSVAAGMRRSATLRGLSDEERAPIDDWIEWRKRARWSLEGAEADLRLRSLQASDDFDEYWDFYLQQ
jgi:hypothetical protein